MDLVFQLLFVTFFLASSNALQCYVGKTILYERDAHGSPSTSKSVTTCASPSPLSQCNSIEIDGVIYYNCSVGLFIGCTEPRYKALGARTCACNTDFCNFLSTNSTLCYKSHRFLGAKPYIGSCDSEVQQCMIEIFSHGTKYSCGPSKDKGFVQGCIKPYNEDPNYKVCVCDGSLCNFVGAKLDSATSAACNLSVVLISIATLIAILNL